MKRRSGLWYWLFALLCAAVVAVGVVVYVRSRKPAPPTYDTVKAERGRITSRVTATGTLSALVTVQVGTQVSGRLQQILVDFNSTVKKGEVIARLDPELFRATVEQATANHTAAQANLAKAEAQALDADRQADRSKALFERNLIAAADRDTAVANAQAARAQVQASRGALEQARASLHQAQVNLQYCTIKSPIDGVVISRSVDVGQTVAASLQAPTLFTIAEDLRKMQVDTNVAEADVGKLTPGMDATFTVDAYPTERFMGTVRQIRNAPQTVQNVVTYDAVIDVNNSALKLKPGMTANVTFVYADKRDVLRIPNAALRFKPSAELMAKIRGDAARGGGAEPSDGDSRGGAPRGPGSRASSEQPMPGPSTRSADFRAPGAPEAAGSADAGAGPTDGGAPRWERRHGSGGSGADGWRGGKEQGGADGALDRRTVWVLRDGQPASASIQIGISDGSSTEILGGDLHEGDAVITQSTSGTDSQRPSSTTTPPGGGMMRRMF